MALADHQPMSAAYHSYTSSIAQPTYAESGLRSSHRPSGEFEMSRPQPQMHGFTTTTNASPGLNGGSQPQFPTHGQQLGPELSHPMSSSISSQPAAPFASYRRSPSGMFLVLDVNPSEGEANTQVTVTVELHPSAAFNMPLNTLQLRLVFGRSAVKTTLKRLKPNTTSNSEEDEILLLKLIADAPPLSEIRSGGHSGVSLTIQAMNSEKNIVESYTFGTFNYWAHVKSSQTSTQGLSQNPEDIAFSVRQRSRRGQDGRRSSSCVGLEGETPPITKRTNSKTYGGIGGESHLSTENLGIRSSRKRTRPADGFDENRQEDYFKSGKRRKSIYMRRTQIARSPYAKYLNDGRIPEISFAPCSGFQSPADLTRNWNEYEITQGRRLVLLHINREAHRITFSAETTTAEEYKKNPDLTIISLLFRPLTGTYVFTSVDIIFLLERTFLEHKISTFGTEEKNRIRRNLQGLHPVTIRKGQTQSDESDKSSSPTGQKTNGRPKKKSPRNPNQKPGRKSRQRSSQGPSKRVVAKRVREPDIGATMVDFDEGFYTRLMTYEPPRPYNISKSIKVFDWDYLLKSINLIAAKYWAFLVETESEDSSPDSSLTSSLVDADRKYRHAINPRSRSESTVSHDLEAQKQIQVMPQVGSSPPHSATLPHLVQDMDAPNNPMVQQPGFNLAVSDQWDRRGSVVSLGTTSNQTEDYYHDNLTREKENVARTIHTGDAFSNPYAPDFNFGSMSLGGQGHEQAYSAAGMFEPIQPFFGDAQAQIPSFNEGVFSQSRRSSLGSEFGNLYPGSHINQHDQNIVDGSYGSDHQHKMNQDGTLYQAFTGPNQPSY